MTDRDVDSRSMSAAYLNKPLKVIPLKGIPPHHGLQDIGILLRGLADGFRARAAGCCRNRIWREERGMVSAVAQAVHKKDNERCA